MLAPKAMHITAFLFRIAVQYKGRKKLTEMGRDCQDEEKDLRI
jgi:hypothetical protein